MTVRQLPKECNAHYNTTRNWLTDNKIKKTNNTRNSQFSITNDVISMAKEHFSTVNYKAVNEHLDINNFLVE